MFKLNRFGWTAAALALAVGYPAAGQIPGRDTPKPGVGRDRDREDEEIVTGTVEGRIKGLRRSILQIASGRATATFALTKSTRFTAGSYEAHKEYFGLTGAEVSITYEATKRGSRTTGREATHVAFKVAQAEGKVLSTTTTRLVAEVVVTDEGKFDPPAPRPGKDKDKDKAKDKDKDKKDRDKDEDKGDAKADDRGKKDEKPRKVVFGVTKYTLLTLDGEKLDKVRKIKPDTKVRVMFLAGTRPPVALSIVAGEGVEAREPKKGDDDVPDWGKKKDKDKTDKDD